MNLPRRYAIGTFGLTAIGTLLLPLANPLKRIAQTNLSAKSAIEPRRLQIGDTVALINPAAFNYEKEVQPFFKVLDNLGLKVKLGEHFYDRYGYLAGKDADRAADVNTAFADDEVQAIFTGMGGWGCNRILPLLDYNIIRNNPKIIIGFSDITALLLAIYAKTNIVTFHGPLGVSSWSPFTVNYLKKVLFDGGPVTLQNSQSVPFQTIGRGTARGKLIGGNLSVIAAMVGSAYLPEWEKSILFVEEVGEEVYRIDRMLTQLKLAGILDRISGFIFGQCTKCDAEKPQESLTLAQVLSDHIRPLKIPAWYGSMVGHIREQFTLPIGKEVEIDANSGTIKLS
ncbi:LD-carboxypeptidase [Microcoleus sp. LEGE 07076]|uniref:S66 peptidase family protein n=1 Tax=Microcoleus sp. LEGE 07076 TaxID=915322 RepID=UPI0018810715|nr:LD-carboxypeptidase [Microcoleus sp. LEGE 07076]MBE9184913.1 LD-carboxypeptidase [Microcoleus sp. LEGE 07076]